MRQCRIKWIYRKVEEEEDDVILTSGDKFYPGTKVKEIGECAV